MCCLTSQTLVCTQSSSIYQKNSSAYDHQQWTYRPSTLTTVSYPCYQFFRKSDALTHTYGCNKCRGNSEIRQDCFNYNSASFSIVGYWNLHQTILRDENSANYKAEHRTAFSKDFQAKQNSPHALVEAEQYIAHMKSGRTTNLYAYYTISSLN